MMLNYVQPFLSIFQRKWPGELDMLAISSWPFLALSEHKEPFLWGKCSLWLRLASRFPLSLRKVAPKAPVVQGSSLHLTTNWCELTIWDMLKIMLILCNLYLNSGNDEKYFGNKILALNAQCQPRQMGACNKWWYKDILQTLPLRSGKSRALKLTNNSMR